MAVALVAQDKAHAAGLASFNAAYRLKTQSNKCLWPAPYNKDSVRSAYRFVTKCCWSYIEADGTVELIPGDKRYIKKLIRKWWECRRTGRTLIIEKSRRLIVSWILRALQLWAMGLKRCNHVIVGLTYAKAAEHVWRIWHLWSKICSNLHWFKLDAANHWGGDPEGQSLDKVLLPNGSLISKINQESDTFQGSGYSEVDLEEFSLYDQPAGILSQARFVTEGVPGKVGGFVVIVTNAAENPSWQECKQDATGIIGAHGKIPHIKAREMLGLDPSSKTCLIMPGMAITTARNGAMYIALHYSSDPSKGPAWALETSKKYTTREWDEQMELHEGIYSGEPVLKDFSPSRHCPKAIQETGIPIVRLSAYFGGWDVDLRPSFILLQVTPEYQIQAILEVTSEGGESMELFCPRVTEALRKRLPGRWNEIMHCADPTCVNRTAADGNSVQKVAAAHGFRLKPQSNVWGVRLSDMEWALTDEVEARVSRFVVDPIHCPVLHTGFKGRYKFRESSGDEIGPGRVINKPLKDGYAGPQDACQYGMRQARRFCEGKFTR
jgi:hypothetical protein